MLNDYPYLSKSKKQAENLLFIFKLTHYRFFEEFLRF